jgi:Spy/CpxP family protein refolding chaperone
MKRCTGYRIVPLLVLALCGGALAAEDRKPAPREDGSQNLDDLGRDFRDWIARWWRYFGGTTPHEQQPVISLMLRNREKLNLAEDQVKKLEELRSDFEKESIRNDADVRVAEIDLNQLLQAPNVDLPKAEGKIRELERLRADLRIARLRAVEKAKALLTPEQRKRLQEILGDHRLTRLQPSARGIEGPSTTRH